MLNWRGGEREKYPLCHLKVSQWKEEQQIADVQLTDSEHLKFCSVWLFQTYRCWKLCKVPIISNERIPHILFCHPPPHFKCGSICSVQFQFCDDGIFLLRSNKCVKTKKLYQIAHMLNNFLFLKKHKVHQETRIPEFWRSDEENLENSCVQHRIDMYNKCICL